MTSIIRTTAAIIVMAMTFTTSFGKTHTMTTNQYNQTVNKVDSSIIGTWERNPGIKHTMATTFCQFNANGTYISFESKQGKYTVTGRGKWMIENETIYIIHGTEKSVPVIYEAEESRLVFGDNVFYTKPSAVYASK